MKRDEATPTSGFARKHKPAREPVGRVVAYANASNATRGMLR